MSDFLQPTEDDFKAMVDDIFVQRQTLKKKDNRPTHRLQLPNAPVLPKEEQEKYAKIGLEEMEQVRQAFLDFQDAISHLVVYSYLYPHIEQFASIAEDLVDLIEHNIDKDDLTDVGLVDYEKLMRIRNRLLDQIKNKY